MENIKLELPESKIKIEIKPSVDAGDMMDLESVERKGGDISKFTIETFVISMGEVKKEDIYTKVRALCIKDWVELQRKIEEIMKEASDQALSVKKN